MENTDAASVDPKTEPINKLSNHSNCNIYLQNNPVNNAVNITPTDDNTND